MAIPLIRLSLPATKVLAQLRNGPRTVDELAKALHLTPNAVRNQLAKLQTLSLTARSGARPSASKPSVLYSITLEGQIQFSTLYLPVLTQFLQVAERRCSGAQLETFMGETGKALAMRYHKPAGGLRERVNAAARLLTSFGGVCEVRSANKKLVIRSAGCPLGALTSDHPAVCKVLECLLSEYLETRVGKCCSYFEEPRCCFEVPA
ncbi:MAG: ArsR family transcriptional regulator [Gemmatimonadales bacterium]